MSRLLTVRAATVLLTLAAILIPARASAQHRAMTHPPDLPVAVRVEVSGDRPWARLMARADLMRLVAVDPALELTETTPEAVADGRQRGYRVEVRLESGLERIGGRDLMQCAMHQTIFDLRLRALRGSAVQRAAVAVAGPVDRDSVAEARRMCVSALVPVVLEGVHDYLSRARR